MTRMSLDINHLLTKLTPEEKVVSDGPHLPLAQWQQELAIPSNEIGSTKP
jgi:hypothetical protein